MRRDANNRPVCLVTTAGENLLAVSPNSIKIPVNIEQGLTLTIGVIIRAEQVHGCSTGQLPSVVKGNTCGILVELATAVTSLHSSVGAQPLIFSEINRNDAGCALCVVLSRWVGNQFNTF